MEQLFSNILPQPKGEKFDPAKDLCFQIVTTAVEDLVLAEFYIKKLGIGELTLSELSKTTQFPGVSRAKTVNEVKEDIKEFFFNQDNIILTCISGDITGNMIYNIILKRFESDWCDTMHNTCDYFTWKEKAKKFNHEDLVLEYCAWLKRYNAKEKLKKRDRERIELMLALA